MEKEKDANDATALSALWHQLNVTVNIVNDEELKNFPKGPFIAISRHLTGDMDYPLMLCALQMADRKSKVVTYGETAFSQRFGNNLVELEDRKVRKEFYKLLDKKHKLNKHLDAGGAIGVFPAQEGIISKEGKGFDKVWEPAVIKLIRDLQLPVVPISFQATEPKLLKQLKAHLENPEEHKVPEERSPAHS